MKQYVYLAVLAAAFSGFSAPTMAEEPAASAQPAAQKHKVAYHINYNDPKLVNAALGNVKNHINAVGVDNLDLVVVLHGDGLDFLKKAKDDIELQSKVVGLREQKVKFAVCNNTLKARNIKLEDLFEVAEADIVPAGVVELAKLQEQGYAYIKP
jgi:intracellular sulfur oxidation DsrE/DsrF family protein